MEAKVGHIAFLVGVAIAVVSGLFASSLADMQSYITLLLVVLGLIVGFLNVTSKETVEFLVAAVALLGASGAQFGVIAWMNLGAYLTAVVSQIGVFVAPAAVVVALKAVWSLAQD